MAAWRYKISHLMLKKYFMFQHWKRNFVSLHGHVISSVSVLPDTFSIMLRNFCFRKINRQSAKENHLGYK